MQYRLFACDYAEHVLTRERELGYEPDPRSWQVVEEARKYALGQTTPDALAAACDAASDAVVAASGVAVPAHVGYAAVAALGCGAFGDDEFTAQYVCYFGLQAASDAAAVAAADSVDRSDYDADCAAAYAVLSAAVGTAREAALAAEHEWQERRFSFWTEQIASVEQ